ncbi:MAG TPA: carbon-nitrogen hydrolase family protein, partial [Planctomycetes bacterium]|nr:carbon-nitrogen hydrolase family protein [Planctomycetota bacterium]
MTDTLTAIKCDVPSAAVSHVIERTGAMIARRLLQICVVLISLLSTGWAQDDTLKSDAGSSDQKTLTVAVVSPKCLFGDPEANLKHFTELAEQAAARKARLICFPELALALAKQLLSHLWYSCVVPVRQQVIEEDFQILF